MIVDDSKVPSALYRAPLHVACARGHLEIVKELLAHQNIDVNLLVNNFTPLHAAVSNGQLEVLRLLLADSRVNVNVQDDSGDSPLNLCCRLGAIQSLHELCRHPKVDLHLANYSGRAPFVQALASGETEIATALLNYLE